MENKNKRILIVEDDHPIARALELKFNKSGFTAIAVYNGREALDILAKQKFDMILTDLIMPDVDGFALLKELRLKKVKTPVIVSSNLSQEEDAIKAKELGAVDFIIKSNTPLNKIVEKVKNLL